jgi:hypothetical protein
MKPAGLCYAKSDARSGARSVGGNLALRRVGASIPVGRNRARSGILGRRTAQGVSPFDLVARVLSERLQRHDASEQLRAMLSSHIDWERVVGYASAQFVLPAFAAALRDLGLGGSLDEELSAFLEAVHAANMERNTTLRSELSAAVATLNRVGIEPVLLKGAIRLLDGLYPDYGWRALRDLDLLVSEAEWADAVEVLRRAGYGLICEVNEINKEAPLRRRGAPAKIDLHRELFSTSRRERLLPARTVLDGSRRVELGDISVRLPCIVHQVVHLIGHSQLEECNYAHGRIASRDWLEALALVHWQQERIDWQTVYAHFVAVGCRRPLLTFLLSLNGDGACAVPVPARIDAPTALQRRRIALQARSPMFAQVSLRTGWCVSELKRQIEERDAGQRLVMKNLKRLMFERGAVGRMWRALVHRQRHLAHVMSPLISLASW